MASRWINAILWTLVGVNLIALVLGGLVTWLAHTIPFRLKQFGLSPEITQAAGFASLLVACLGLCALNYSSHYALNVYGLSCAIFLVLMLFGLLPESWQRLLLLHNPSATTSGQLPVAAGSNRPQQQHHHHNSGGLLLIMVHFALLVLLAAVLSFAFILARYLRRKQRAYDDNREEQEQDVHDARRASDPFGGASFDCGTPSCTCSLGGRVTAASAAQHTTTMGFVESSAGRAHTASYANNGRLHRDDDIQVMPYGGDGGGDAWRGPSNYSASNYHGGDAAANMERFLPPLVARGIYRSDTREKLDNDVAEYNQRHANIKRLSQAAQDQRHLGPGSSLLDNQNDNRCRCDPPKSAPSPKSGVAATLAAKLNQDYQYYNHLQLKSQYYNTMPNNLAELSSVYAIKSAMAQRRAMEAKRKKAKATGGGSMLAMTAAAAAALFGGVVDSSGMAHDGGGTTGAADLFDNANMDDGLHELTDENFAEALMSHHYQDGGAGYNFDNNQHLAPGDEQKDIGGAGGGGGPAFDFGVY